MEEGIEGEFVSKILMFKETNYFIGLNRKNCLSIKEEWISSVVISDKVVKTYRYNIKTKETTVADHGELALSFSFDSHYYAITDMNNNGMRWEGIVKIDSPCGYGSLYNDDNKLIYRGVMIGDKKECFGIDFYPGLEKIEYIGCYCNNERHGFGILYDGKGELIYEGDWFCGSNDYDKIENVILKDVGNDRIVHSLIHELVIDKGCGNDYKGDLRLCGFVNLERIVVKKNSFQNVNSLEISDNYVLKSIEIENGGLRYDGLRYGPFHYVENVIISSSLMIYD